MNDFETLIGKMLADGKSSEDIASLMTDALNKAEKQKKDAEVKTTKAKVVDNMVKVFNESVESGNLDLVDMAAGITIAAVKDPKMGEDITTADDVMRFYNIAVDTIKQIPMLYRTQAKIGELLDMFTGGKHETPPPSARKETPKPTNKSKSKDEDWEKVQAFLNEIFGGTT